MTDPNEALAREAFRKWYAENSRCALTMTGEEFAQAAWNAARREVDSLKIENASKMQLINDYGEVITKQATRISDLEGQLIARRDGDAEDAARFRWLVESRFGNHDGRFEFFWAYGPSPLPGPSIEDVRSMIDADREVKP
jgi:hypothetical protein